MEMSAMIFCVFCALITPNIIYGKTYPAEHSKQSTAELQREVEELLNDVYNNNEDKKSIQWLRGRFGKEVHEPSFSGLDNIGRFGREPEHEHEHEKLLNYVRNAKPGRFGRRELTEQWLRGRFGRELSEQWLRGRFGRELSEQWLRGRFGRELNGQWLRGRFGREMAEQWLRGRFGRSAEHEEKHPKAAIEQAHHESSHHKSKEQLVKKSTKKM